MLGGFISVFFQIRNKWRATGTNCMGIGLAGFMLFENVIGCIFQMFATKLFNPVNALIIGLLQSCVSLALLNYIFAYRRTLFYCLYESPMFGRHVVAHFI